MRTITLLIVLMFGISAISQTQVNFKNRQYTFSVLNGADEALHRIAFGGQPYQINDTLTRHFVGGFHGFITDSICQISLLQDSIVGKLTYTNELTELNIAGQNLLIGIPYGCSVNVYFRIKLTKGHLLILP